MENQISQIMDVSHSPKALFTGFCKRNLRKNARMNNRMMMTILWGLILEDGKGTLFDILILISHQSSDCLLDPHKMPGRFKLLQEFSLHIRTSLLDTIAPTPQNCDPSFQRNLL